MKRDPLARLRTLREQVSDEHDMAPLFDAAIADVQTEFRLLRDTISKLTEVQVLLLRGEE